MSQARSLIVLLLMLVLVGLPVFAEDVPFDSATGTNTGETLPKPPLPQRPGDGARTSPFRPLPAHVGSTTNDKPPFLKRLDAPEGLFGQAFIERREQLKHRLLEKGIELPDDLEARRALIRENFEKHRDYIEQNWEERKEHFASTTTLKRAELGEDVKERVLGRAEHIAQLFDAMIARLIGIADRISARLDALEVEGTDVTDAQSALEDAYAAIDAAQAAGEEVKVAFESAFNLEHPGEAMAEVKTQAEEARALLRTAHEALRTVANVLHMQTQEGAAEQD